MNSTTTLLSALALILVIAIVISTGDLTQGQKGSRAEADRIKAEISLLDQNYRELSQLRAQAQDQEEGKMAEIKTRMAEMEAENKQLAAAKEEAEKLASLQEEEAAMAWKKEIEDNTQGDRRAKQIQNALVMARVTEWSAQDGFAVISLVMPESLQQGTELGVRRNTGIIGKLVLSTIYHNENRGIADALPESFLSGEIEVQAGDELIIPPL